MKEDNAYIIENREIAADIFQLILETDITETAAPGQFVELEIPGFFLRRPISIACRKPLTLIYKIAGQGTAALSRLKEGQMLNVFGPLGTGFPLLSKDVLLIGGGVGIPPLYETAKQYRKEGRKVILSAGFNSSRDVFYLKEFQQLGCEVIISTMDGSGGRKGTALDAVRNKYRNDTFVLACGPLAMLKAVSDAYSNGYISIENRMACGMGVCNGCVMKDNEGNSVRVCYDGPVFPLGKVVL